MNAIEEVYALHHTDKERHSGAALLRDVRGPFFSKCIGTGKKVLDIGCRNGAITSYYAQGNDVLGVDIDSGNLALAEKRLGIKTAHFDLNSEWPLKQKSFDAVVASEVLEHLYFPERAAKKVAFVLKDDGVFTGSIPNAFSLINRMRMLFGRKEGTPLADPTHINQFSRDELQKLLLSSFEQVEITPAGRFARLDRFWPGMFSFMLLFEARRPKTSR